MEQPHLKIGKKTGKLVIPEGACFVSHHLEFYEKHRRDNYSGVLAGINASTSICNYRIGIESRTSQRPINVETMHISCKSDTYQSGHNYGGVITYLYKGKSDWRTANNTHCKPGYIVIQDTDSQNVQRWKGTEPGKVHGAVYRNAFGESVNDAKVVGEGFAILNGKFEIKSGVLNNAQDGYHDEHREMHKLSEHCVGKIVEYWKTAGPSWVKQRNFTVKKLLEDFELESNSECITSEDTNRSCNIM